MQPKSPLRNLLPIADGALLAVSSTNASNTGNVGGADTTTTITPGLHPTLPLAPAV